MAAEPERAGPVLRVRIRRSADSWTIEKQVRVPSMTLPASSPAPEGQGRPVAGFWYEATNADGDVIYRRVLDDPTEDSVEVPSQGGDLERVSVERPEVVFDVLVPDVPDVTEIRLFAPRKRDIGVRTALPRIQEPAARLRIRQGRQRQGRS